MDQSSFHRATLDNGIRVVAEHVTGFRSVSVGVWVCAGSRDEPPDLGGVSHFLEHMHFKGTERRTAQDIANEIDAVGGELNAYTSREGTTYYVKVLDEHLEQGLDLLGDILTGSRFAEDDIEREKGPVLEEISMVEDTPDDYVHDLLQDHVWPGGGLGASILGTRETVASFDRVHLLDFVMRNYTADEVVIAAAGNFSFARLIDLLNRQLGSLPRRGRAIERTLPSFRSGLRVYSRDLAEAHLCLGFPGLPLGHDDRYALYVLNAILGSSVSSRLFQEIREKRGLAYSIYSYLASYSDTGMVGIYSGTAPERALEVLRLTLGELARFASEPVPAEDVRRARQQLRGNFILGLESTSARMSQIARDEIIFGRLFTAEEILSGIDQVMPEDVARVAARSISPDNLALVTLGPIDENLFRGQDLPFC